MGRPDPTADIRAHLEWANDYPLDQMIWKFQHLLMALAWGLSLQHAHTHTPSHPLLGVIHSNCSYPSWYSLRSWICSLVSNDHLRNAWAIVVTNIWLISFSFPSVVLSIHKAFCGCLTHLRYPVPLPCPHHDFLSWKLWLKQSLGQNVCVQSPCESIRTQSPLFSQHFWPGTAESSHSASAVHLLLQAAFFIPYSTWHTCESFLWCYHRLPETESFIKNWHVISSVMEGGKSKIEAQGSGVWWCPLVASLGGRGWKKVNLSAVSMIAFIYSWAQWPLELSTSHQPPLPYMVGFVV